MTEEGQIKIVKGQSSPFLKKINVMSLWGEGNHGFLPFLYYL